jgi:Holliday junction resolvase-like predicted endonuclease
VKNTKDSNYKKILGFWGEQQVDCWMQSQNWSVHEKNLRIHGGEIDRIYIHKTNNNNYKMCIAEIKTNCIYSSSSLNEIFTEVGIKKYIKQRQIKNLFKISENYFSKGISEIYLRLFIVLKKKNYIKIDKNLSAMSAIKICYEHDNYYILSITPEFTNINARKSLLEIRL